MLEEERFLEAGDTIRIGWDGSLLDGQHRLEAINRSGVSVWMLVVYDLDPSAQDVMDRGRKRTIGDVLHMHGHPQATMLASAVKWVTAIEGGKLNRLPKNERGTIDLGPDETLASLSAHPGLEDSLRVGAAVKHAAVRYPPSLATALHYLMVQRAGTDHADNFFEMVATGANLQKGDPVWQLLDQLHRDTAKQIKRPYVAYAQYTVKAWNAWRQDRHDVSNFRYIPGFFPELED